MAVCFVLGYLLVMVRLLDFAVVQGEVTALNLLGDHQVIESVGRKYFDLEGVKIKTTWWEDIEQA